jgi:RHS repeat-associated protein
VKRASLSRIDPWGKGERARAGVGPNLTIISQRDNKQNDWVRKKGVGHGNYCVGRLTQVSSSVSTNTYQKHDPMGRILTSNQNTGGPSYPFGYQYNLAGGLKQETYPSGRQVQYTFDGAGREQTLTGYVLSAQYAAHGELSSVKLANGLYDTTNFSPRLEVTDRMLGSSQGATDRWSLHNNYYANSNVQNQTLATGGLNVTQNYTYDNVNRLSTANEMAGGTMNWSRTHGYDAFGNMWISQSSGQAPGINAPTAQSAINASNNQLAGPLGMYDAAGNLQMRMGMSYSYDAENRVTQTQQTVSGTTTTNVYGYDGEGRRVQRTPGNSTTWYVYDAMGQLAAEFDSSSPSQTLTTQFIMTDHLGSTRAVADGSGNLKDCHDYLPFGEEILAPTGNRPSCYTTGTNDQIAQKFTGDERDPETQEDFFKARYFAAPEGRFRSIDPIGIPDDIGDPQGWNKYGYARNNPLLFTDPTGEKCVWTNDKWVDDGKGGGCDTTPRFQVQALPDVNQPLQRLGAVLVGMGKRALSYANDFSGFLGTRSDLIDDFVMPSNAREQIGMNALDFDQSITGGTSLATTGAFLIRHPGTVVESFRSFGALKRALGPAGEGYVWHHIVEQREANVEKFGAEAIHNTKNVVKTLREVNQEVADYYSRVRPFSGGQTVRKWLGAQGLERQRAFGLRILKKVQEGGFLP